MIRCVFLFAVFVQVMELVWKVVKFHVRIVLQTAVYMTWKKKKT